MAFSSCFEKPAQHIFESKRLQNFMLSRGLLVQQQLSHPRFLSEGEKQQQEQKSKDHQHPPSSRIEEIPAYHTGQAIIKLTLYIAPLEVDA